jgi:hypothetical protein
MPEIFKDTAVLYCSKEYKFSPRLCMYLQGEAVKDVHYSLAAYRVISVKCNTFFQKCRR